MSLARKLDRLVLPDSLRDQLLGFRRQVWTIKLAEAALSAGFVVLVTFLALFGFDRLGETPAYARLALFVVAALGGALLPLALHRWVWSHRKLDQLARLLSRKMPLLGDQLLGVIELVENESEQARSRALVEAAIVQVAEDSSKRDFSKAIPTPRHMMWGGLFAFPALATLALAVLAPAATSNAWARLLAPWANTPRYTFAMLQGPPADLVVPHGEPFEVRLTLKDGSPWSPAKAEARLDGQPLVSTGLSENSYTFELPAQIAPVALDISAGDYRQRVKVDPTLRPALTAASAEITLPKYLERPEVVKKDARGGSISLVKGSQAVFAANLSRDIASAQVNGKPVTPQGSTVRSPLIGFEANQHVSFTWKDTLGLDGREPFQVNVGVRDDEAPTVSTENLPRQRVVLDTEQLTFQVHAGDDFGIKQVGMEWQGITSEEFPSPLHGERLLSGGGPDKEALDLTGTFSAKTLGIEPRPINLRIYVEDYLPGRARTYSPAYTFYILNAEQHAIWVTEQLSKWHRQSLEVRDRELQLHETNKQLRALGAAELDRPENRRRLDNQAQAERANGRRLSSLVMSGEELVKQASRNPEIGVGHLEKWAEMLQVMKDISGNRMPSVADMLKEAAQAKTAPSNVTGNQGKMAGQNRGGGGGAPKPAEQKKNGNPSMVPQVADGESSQNGPGKPADPNAKPTQKNPSTPRLGLPTTTVQGQGGKSNGGDPPPPPPTPAEENLEAALEKQRLLLAEFDKVADELNKVLANLEGSTLVKRLKAASRAQLKVATRLGGELKSAFGKTVPAVQNMNGMIRDGMMVQRQVVQNNGVFSVVPQQARKPAQPTAKLPEATRNTLDELAKVEEKSSQDVSVIMDDIAAYFERRQMVRFKNVLDDMRKLDAIGSIRALGDDLKVEQGMTIAQCEFWSDTLDRWAEDLVDPAGSGTCPGGKSRSSLPPSVVLEVLKILEAEVNLREETRVVQQSRSATETKAYARQAEKLSLTQHDILGRVRKVAETIAKLPDGEKEFGPELQLLAAVAGVMEETVEILGRPETGPVAIAAETEAIELLLKSKRINPSGGGGGGSNPGGGGKGSTNDSALALLGTGQNAKEVREDHGVSASSGAAGNALPEEFRAGLDAYFNKIDKGSNNR